MSPPVSLTHWSMVHRHALSLCDIRELNQSLALGNRQPSCDSKAHWGPAQATGHSLQPPSPEPSVGVHKAEESGLAMGWVSWLAGFFHTEAPQDMQKGARAEREVSSAGLCWLWHYPQKWQGLWSPSLKALSYAWLKSILLPVTGFMCHESGTCFLSDQLITATVTTIANKLLESQNAIPFL